MLEFNSTRGNWTGFTAYRTAVATIWNSDPREAVRRSNEKKMLCEESIDAINKSGRRIFSEHHLYFYWLDFDNDSLHPTKINPWSRNIKGVNCENLSFLVNLTTAPIVNIKLVKQHNGGHPAMLVCSAYNFYPKQIQMTWLRNKQEVTTGVHYSDVMADGELYYQIHSHLEFTPTLGETITCVVEHLSLSEPKIIVWGKLTFWI